MAYLRRVPDHGALVLLVPDRRLNSVWAELQYRCTKAKLAFEDQTENGTDRRRAVVASTKTLAAISWRSLLTRMHEFLDATDERQVAADVAQLRGLCDRMDDQAFLPLTSEELTSQHYRRIFDLAGLVDDLLRDLESRRVGDRRGLKQGSAFGFSGRYFYLFGAAVFLACDLRLWMTHGMSPIWITVYGDVASLKANKEAAFAALKPLQQTTPPRLFHDHNGFPAVPLMLPLGVERERVLDALVAELFELRPLLEQLAAEPD